MNVGDPIPSPAELVRAYGRPAKKRLGQNFLTDPGILDRVVRCAGIGEGDRVLEIGPGPGGLTGRLLAAGADVLCLEADAELVEHLERHLGAFERFAVVRGDGTGPDLDRALGDPPRLVVDEGTGGEARRSFRLVPVGDIPLDVWIDRGADGDLVARAIPRDGDLRLLEEASSGGS